MNEQNPLETEDPAPETWMPGEYEAATPARELIAELLNSLGASADEVAVALHDGGFKGIPQVACNCPVFNWLEVMLDRTGLADGTYIEVSGVTRQVVAFASRRPGEAIALGSTRTPEAVQQFIWEFDAAMHPDLIS